MCSSTATDVRQPTDFEREAIAWWDRTPPDDRETWLRRASKAYAIQRATIAQAYRVYLGDLAGNTGGDV